MSDLTTSSAADRTDRTRGKRRPLAAFALAALAVGGVGAALTSAAWTDNVFFAASADAATFDLQGSIDGKDWKQSDADGSIQLVVDPATFAKLLPGESREVTLHVKNLGNVKGALTSSVEWAKGTTFTTTPTAGVSDLAATLSPTGAKGDSDAFTLTVTAPADWDVSNKGRGGTVVVTVSGEATS